MLRRKLFLSSVVLVVLLSCSFVVSVEADASMWSQTYDGGSEDGAFSVLETPDEGYVMSGITGGYFWLVKVDALGGTEWNRTYGPFMTQYLDLWPVETSSCTVCTTSDGGYALVGGESWLLGMEESDFLLIKTDGSGNMEWNQTYGGEADDVTATVVEATGGGYVLAGYTNSFGAGGNDFWLVKTNATGYMEWNRTYGGTENDVACSLVKTSDDGYAIAGYTASFGTGSYDCWVVKTDVAGNVEWNRTYGGKSWRWSVVATSDEGYAIAGWTDSSGTDDFLLVKTNATGYMEWNQTYGFGGFQRAYAVDETTDGGYVITGCTGYAEPWIADDEDFWLVKTDANGEMEWNQIHGREYDERAYSVVATSDGGYAITGMTRSFGDRDIWLVKTDEYGNVPEHSSLLLTSLLLVAVLVIVVNKKKLFKQRL